MIKKRYRIVLDNDGFYTPQRRYAGLSFLDLLQKFGKNCNVLFVPEEYLEARIEKDKLPKFRTVKEY